jgi:hypothetical protein
MRRELDEIEMELKGASMKVGDWVRTYYTRKEGVITGPCPRHEGNWLVDVGDETCDVKCAAECNLTPVEPERVRWCRYYGRCVLMTGDWCEGLGENTCGAYATLAPSSGLLQRMGMATWEEEREWFVMAMPRSENAGWMLGTLMTKDQAEKALSSWCLRPDCDYRILRWQDGLR